MKPYIKSFGDFLVENTVIDESVKISGKKINVQTLKVDGIDDSDEDFAGAYFSYGEFENGKELTDKELKILTTQEPKLLSDTIVDMV